jgi:hypothetical protein
VSLEEGVKQLYAPSAWGHMFHSLPHNEALGAGAAGPGKTQVLLMDPFQQIAVEHERCMNPEHPHHLPWGASSGWAIHLRRTNPNLENVIKRSHKLFPIIDPGARWNENKRTWTFRSGFQFQFGHCHDTNDWENYLGSEFTHIGWDELITFDEEQYDQVNARLRSSDPVLRGMLKIRAASNPMMTREKGDNYSIKDPNWVRRRFVDPAPEGRVTLQKELKMRDGTKKYWTSIYLPATLYDNPDKAFVEDYEFKLQNAKPHIRQAYLYGNWYTTAGSFYGDVWNQALHVCKPFKIPKEWPKFRSMDWGFKHPGAVHWYAMDPDGNLIVVRELIFKGMNATDVAKAILQIEKGMGLSNGKRSKLNGWADTQLWEDRGDSTKGKATEMFEAGVTWAPAKKGAGSRLRHAELLYDRLGDHDSGTTTPGIIFFESCHEIIKLIPSVGTSDKNSEEPADGNDDDALDSVFYGCGYASNGRAGLGWKSSDADDKDDDEEEEKKGRRGRWGYGSKVM